MIEINEESLKYAYAKLKKYVYYSNSNYIRDKLYKFELKLETNPNIFKDMADKLNYLGTKEFDMLKYKFPKCTFYPKKDAMKDINNGFVSVKTVNSFIDMDIEFFLIDILFCLELIDAYNLNNNGLFYGNLIQNKLLEMSEFERIHNNLLFEKYWPNYQKWKKAISSDLNLNEIENSTLIKLDFHRCFYNVKFNLSEFLEKYKLDLSNSIIKLSLNVYRAYSYTISKYINEPKEQNIVQLPVGLPSANIIQNILFNEFDKKINANSKTIRYGRYVDDVLILARGDLKKEEFLEAYNEIFSVKSKDTMQAIVNSIFLKPLELNPKKIEIHSGSTIERLNDEIDRILSPSMLDYWNEEEHDNVMIPNNNEADDTLNFKYMKKYIDNYLESDNKVDDMIKYLEARKPSELLNLYICWNKILRIIRGTSYSIIFIRKIRNIIENINYLNEDAFFSNNPKILDFLKASLKNELNTAIYLSRSNNYYLFEVTQKDLFDYLALVDEGKNQNVFYPASIKFEYVQLFYSYKYEFTVDYIEKCKEIYLKANGYELNQMNPMNNTIINVIRDCDLKLVDGEEQIIEYSKAFVLKNYSEINQPVNDFVDTKSEKNAVKIAIASIDIPVKELCSNEFKGMYSSTYNLRTIYKLINEAAKLGAKYIIIPEFCIVFGDALYVINYCARHKISIVAGLSHCFYRSGYAYNYVLIYDDECKFAHLKSKNYYPYEERQILAFNGYKPGPTLPYYILIDDGKIKYSTMTCYEATNIRDRAFLNNKINLLFMPVYNKDTTYFSNIIGSFSRDISSFVAQSNNSEYGDSRLTGPMSSQFAEIVQLKGGENSYVVVGRIDIDSMYEKHKKMNDIDKNIEDMSNEPSKIKRKALNDKIEDDIDKDKTTKQKYGKFKPLSAGSIYDYRKSKDLE